MGFSNIRLARIASEMEATLESIASDMESGEYTREAISAELDAVADIVESLEKAGYEVEVDPSIVDRLSGKEKGKDDKKEEKEEEKAEKEGSDPRVAAMRHQLAVRRAMRARRVAAEQPVKTDDCKCQRCSNYACEAPKASSDNRIAQIRERIAAARREKTASKGSKALGRLSKLVKE